MKQFGGKGEGSRNIESLRAAAGLYPSAWKGGKQKKMKRLPRAPVDRPTGAIPLPRDEKRPFLKIHSIYKIKHKPYALSYPSLII